MKLSRKIFNWYSQNVISCWTVFAIDNLLVALNFWASLLLLSDFQDFNTLGWFRVLEKSAVVLLLYAMSFLMFRSFVGIIRHTSIADASRILRANSSAAFL
ncbi:MAG: hypothetical protein ACKOHH_12095 [Bacteroidota bacterium]